MAAAEDHGGTLCRTSTANLVPAPQTAAEPRLGQIAQELERRADPDRVSPASGLDLPWSPEAGARRQARRAALEASLDIFTDDLRAVRIANEVLNRAATTRAAEAAEVAVLEVRCLGESARLAIVNHAHEEMTRQFLAHLETLESFRERVTPELLDALKERALLEFSDRMTRASKADIPFDVGKILRLSE